MDGRCENHEKRGNCRFESECSEKVIPPTVGVQLTEQVERVLLHVVRINQADISKVREWRLRKQECCFNHEQRRDSCRNDSFQRASAVTHETERHQQYWQRCAGELTGHSSPQSQAGTNVASFPKEVEGQYCKDC